VQLLQLDGSRLELSIPTGDRLIDVEDVARSELREVAIAILSLYGDWPNRDEDR
jgi:hypothetical protein